MPHHSDVWQFTCDTCACNDLRKQKRKEKCKQLFVFWSFLEEFLFNCTLQVLPEPKPVQIYTALRSRYILLGGEIAQPNLCPNLPSRINIFLFMISNFYLPRQYRRNDKIQLPLLFLTFRSRLSIYWILSLISCHREFVVMITSLGQCTGIHV